MPKPFDEVPAEWVSAARQVTTAIDLSQPPRGRRPRKRRSILAFGRPADRFLARLRDPGLSLVVAVDLQDFIWLLAAQKYDAIVALPDDAGIHALRMVTHGEVDDAVTAELHFMATQQNGDTPVLLLPMRGEDEFTLVVSPPEHIYFFRVDRVEIDWVIKNLDAANIRRGPPS